MKRLSAKPAEGSLPQQTRWTSFRTVKEAGILTVGRRRSLLAGNRMRPPPGTICPPPGTITQFFLLDYLLPDFDERPLYRNLATSAFIICANRSAHATRSVTGVTPRAARRLKFASRSDQTSPATYNAYWAEIAVCFYLHVSDQVPI